MAESSFFKDSTTYDQIQSSVTILAQAQAAQAAAAASAAAAAASAALLNTRQVIAGNGLIGGGPLATDVTLNVGAGTGITVAADTVGLDTTSTRNVDHSTIVISAGTGLSGGGDTTASRTLTLNPAALATIGGVKAVNAVAHQWINSIDTTGAPQLSQPAASDISGLAASATTDTTNATNITSGTLPAARLPLPAAASLGGIKSNVGAANQWVSAINTDGSVTLTQPAFSNVSGSVAATQMPAHTGDVTSSAGTVALTIAANVVTNAKAAQMAANTIKGNNTGATANAADLTAAQATAILNAVVGDSGSGGTKGLVPAPAAGDAAAGKFLKANGAWTTPAGGGDVIAANNGTEFNAATFATNLALVRTVKKQTFSTSGTYTPSTGMLYCIITAVGGAGGGGGVTGNASGHQSGGGGGGGGISRHLATALDIGASKAIAIGAAGTGGGGGATGNSGGNTTVGTTLVVANGGAGGQGAGAFNGGSGGAGGAAGTGNISASAGLPGLNGYGASTNTAAFAAAGGGHAPHYGVGAAPTQGTGGNGLGFGAGGAGGFAYATATSFAGGNGTAGFVEIIEFCTQ